MSLENLTLGTEIRDARERAGYTVAKIAQITRIRETLIKDIEAGDMLYWNGENAGYELDPLDDIDFEYEASNLDI